MVIAILLVNVLPFKTRGESTGFIVSVVALYFIPFGVFVLYTESVLKLIQKQQVNTGRLVPAKSVLYLIPLVALYGAIHILFFVLPQAISEGDYMRYNGISMVLGLTFGGTRSIYRIRENITDISK